MPGKTIQLYLPPGFTPKVTRRKTNTSLVVELLVNKDDVVQLVKQPIPEPMPPGTVVYATGYADGYYVT